MLAEMAERGCDYCFMEVSSHSIVQERIAGLTFAGGIFTNITHEHLDYHGTFAEYIRAKKRFFDHLPKGAFALVNTDDRNGAVMVQNSAATTYTYALRRYGRASSDGSTPTTSRRFTVRQGSSARTATKRCRHSARSHR